MSQAREAGKPCGDAGIPRALAVGGCQYVLDTATNKFLGSGFRLKKVPKFWSLGNFRRAVASKISKDTPNRQEKLSDLFSNREIFVLDIVKCRFGIVEDWSDIVS